jgi:hypothetical protein
MDSAHHVIRIHSIQEPGVQNAFDDVAGTVHQSLGGGDGGGGGGGGGGGEGFTRIRPRCSLR